MPADALDRIRARGHIGIRLGLARMRSLLARLDDPQQGLRGVLIGGTNGKGSVAAMVASMLGAAGFSTMQSPSPHLHHYRERILIDGQPIAATDFATLLERVLSASDAGEAQHGPATEFELLTAAAYLWAAERSVDVVVMEVGLGGRLDASNCWDADVAAITNVGLDHQEFLGTTIESIASEKAAIIKAGSRAVTGASGAALRIIEAQARQVGAPLATASPREVVAMDRSGIVIDDDELGELRLPMLGRHQAANASIAMACTAALAHAGVAEVPATAVRSGLRDVRWPGRSELLMVDHQAVLLDGAHNPDGMATLAATIDELAPWLPTGRATLLVAVMADKDVARMLAGLAASELLGHARFVGTTVPGSDRTSPAEELAAAWTAASGARDAECHEDADAALSRASRLAAADGGLLVVAGSLYLVGHVRGRLLPDEIPR